jgi:hypothetical protein
VKGGGEREEGGEGRGGGGEREREEGEEGEEREKEREERERREEREERERMDLTMGALAGWFDPYAGIVPMPMPRPKKIWAMASTHTCIVGVQWVSAVYDGRWYLPIPA